jgi:hypothetical protein
MYSEDRLPRDECRRRQLSRPRGCGYVLPIHAMTPRTPACSSDPLASICRDDCCHLGQHGRKHRRHGSAGSRALWACSASDRRLIASPSDVRSKPVFPFSGKDASSSRRLCMERRLVRRTLLRDCELLTAKRGRAGRIRVGPTTPDAPGRGCSTSQTVLDSEKHMRDARDP